MKDRCKFLSITFFSVIVYETYPACVQPALSVAIRPILFSGEEKLKTPKSLTKFYVILENILKKKKSPIIKTQFSLGNFIFHFPLMKVKKSSSSYRKNYLTKVVPNIASYCSKFFLFWRNLKNERVMAKKPIFITIIPEIHQKDRFFAITRSFLRFR